MGFTHIVGTHKHTKKQVEAIEQLIEKRDGDCSNGLYQAPQLGASVNSLDPLPITWDPTCIDSRELDIYLFSPGSNNSRIHVWTNVANSRGTYTADLMPRWWGSTAEQSLQVVILPAGGLLFQAKYPNGPVFTATYTEPASGVPAAADTNQIDPSGVTPVNDLATKPGLSPGKKAAAVLIPLLFIILCVTAYFKMKRSRNKDKRKKWTEAVDKRMSTISADWKSVSAAGANAAIRNSIAVGARNSSFSFGAIRPSSTFGVEGGEEKDPNEGRRTVTGVGLRNPAALSSTERVSRVSFAPDTRVSRVSFADSVSRPSGESRRTRAFHSAYVPPVPALPDQQQQDKETEKNSGSVESDPTSFSPRQTQGALTLTPEDIRSRITSKKSQEQAQSYPEEKNGFAEFLPALSMMRTGGDDKQGQDDFLFPTPVSPPPAYAKPATSISTAFASQQQQPAAMNSPVMSSMPMQPMPASVMSPDEMLRAYAERKKLMANNGSISYPAPAATTGSRGTPTPPPVNSNGMRVLYNANTGTVSPNHTGNNGSVSVTPTAQHAYNGSVGNNPFGAAAVSIIGAPPPAASNTTSLYSQASHTSSSEAYVTAQTAHHGYAFGHHANESIGVGKYGGAKYSIGDDEDDGSIVGRAA
ncbi:hypothetical protein CPC08DRAFT_767542 [Agrocybe pediades]|nr:hypothetical protein CPC08DRAFT_767542 [Agrocybe pediades]